MIFDYEGVKWALNDHETFSSCVPAPQWFIFFDAPAHTKLRALVSQAFTPGMVANLDRSIRELSRRLLDQTLERGEMDLPNDFSATLAMQVIAGIIGIPGTDWTRYKQWSDVILRLSYARSGGEEAEQALRDFTTVTAEMDACLADMIRRRRDTSRDDLLTRRMETEVNGEKLSQAEILGFFQPDL